jgi:hypothetical protein
VDWFDGELAHDERHVAEIAARPGDVVLDVGFVLAVSPLRSTKGDGEEIP